MTKFFSKKSIQDSSSEEDPEDKDCPAEVDGSVTDSDVEEGAQDDATFQFAQPDTTNVELTFELEALVKKIRDTAKMFRNSPVSNDMLQKCVKADPDINQFLKLKLDVKTRWNSMEAMLGRHHKIRYINLY